ncbi:MAG: carbohydrate ABC transporter permease [Pseudomonadota bacterium]
MSDAKVFRATSGVKISVTLFLTFWLILAAFPLFWVLVMSFKLPVDAFSANPFYVIFGPDTRSEAGGFSILDLIIGIASFVLIYKVVSDHTRWLAERVSFGITPLGWLVAAGIVLIAGFAYLAYVLPLLSSIVNGIFGFIPLLNLLAEPVLGITFQHYQAVWVENEFYRNFLNSLMITAGVVTISLTVGTLAGYALARTPTTVAFALLIAALVFRALPHSVLVTGYLPVFVNSAEILAPILGENAPTLYGQPLAVIAVLVSINQPFTIWMLRSFFQSIPQELDEAARVDGCSHLEAFWRVIMPVMWPGVITTGLFSFLLAYNDYLVTALLLDAQNQTMVPAITQYFNRETTTTDQVEAIAAAVSITAPLFLLVMVFQRQIVSGLTAGAVKG